VTASGTGPRDTMARDETLLAGAGADRVENLEQALWRAERRAEAAEATIARLEEEHAGQLWARKVLVREQQADREAVERLRHQVEALTERLEAAQTTLAQLRDRLFTGLIRLESIQKERLGLSRLLGRMVQSLLGCRPEDRPSRWRFSRSVRKLAASGLVDADWYNRRYPDVVSAGMDPVRHYLRHGSGEGRDPRAPAGDSGPTANPIATEKP